MVFIGGEAVNGGWYKEGRRLMEGGIRRGRLMEGGIRRGGG